MQNPDSASPATLRVAAPRRHDLGTHRDKRSEHRDWLIPGIGRHVRNRDIDEVRSNQVRNHKSSLIDVRCALDRDQNSASQPSNAMCQKAAYAASRHAFNQSARRLRLWSH
jgi:hypothetical protein